MSITTLAKVKGALQIPTGVTVHDTRIAELVDEVSEELLQRTTLDAWTETTYTEYHDVNGTTDVLLTRRFPVRSSVALTLIDTSEALVDGTDYQWEASGKFSLLDGRLFPLGRRQVVVTYTAGAFAGTSTTSDLVRVATLAAAWQYNREPVAGLEVADLRPIRRTMQAYDDDAVRIEIDRVIARYRSPF